MGDGIAQTYGLDSWTAREQLEFANATLVLILNTDICYVGSCIIDCSVMNTTNLNKPIPVGSRYEEQTINPSGASFGRMHTEMPDFHGLASHTTSVHGLFTIGITALDAMSRGVGPKLIIGNRDIAKSAVTIDRIIDQDACN